MAPIAHLYCASKSCFAVWQKSSEMLLPEASKDIIRLGIGYSKLERAICCIDRIILGFKKKLFQKLPLFIYVSLPLCTSGNEK